jgi:hypothetical protein
MENRFIRLPLSPAPRETRRMTAGGGMEAYLVYCPYEIKEKHTDNMYDGAGDRNC